MLLDALFGGSLNWNYLLAGVLSSLAVIFFTLPLHEWAHAFVATKLGDPTPKYQGRLSINPFKHIDYIGALMIIFVGIGWAKPVNVDMRYFKGFTQSATAKALGMTQVQVSRREKTILKILRENLT